MAQFRALTVAEIKQLEQQGNFSRDWQKVLVADEFSADGIYTSFFEGDVHLSKGVKIYASRISNYEIGENTAISNVGRLECTGLTTFGNGTRVAAVNENGGRSVVIYDGLNAQTAYVMAMYRHIPSLQKHLELMVDAHVTKLSSSIGLVGNNVAISDCKIIRNCKIADNAVVEGASLLKNGTILERSYVGVDVKMEDFIVAEDARVDLGATLERCFVGEKCIVSSSFTGVDSLFFAQSHLENGEACSIFAGPYTVSHHKSSLLIAGLFSFFNAGSGTNQSNHLFKEGAVHQAVHRRGCKFASSAYVMAPAAEGMYTMIMGRHTHHHDTSNLPFSYLIERDGKSFLMPGAALRSYGTKRDIAKWELRDKRTVKRDLIHYSMYNPCVAWSVLKGIEILRALIDTTTTTEVIRYKGVESSIGLAKLGVSLYEKYLRATVAELIAACPDAPHGKLQKWVDVSGAYFPKKFLDGMLKEIEKKAMQIEDVNKIFHEFDNIYVREASSWAKDLLREMIGHKPSEEEIKAAIEQGKVAHQELQKMCEADLQRDRSIEMSIGYGTDDEEIRMKDYYSVRGIKK